MYPSRSCKTVDLVSETLSTQSLNVPFEQSLNVPFVGGG